MPSWSESLAALRDGDLDARDRIVRLVIGALRSFGAYDLRDSWNDVVQDVLLTLLEQAPSSDQDAAVAAWIRLGPAGRPAASPRRRPASSKRSSATAGPCSADRAAAALGSRGVSHSASFGEQGRAVYQTGHGAARDLAGSDRANPLGQILSLASLLEESFGLGELAAAVRTGTQAVLTDGWRTPDLLAPGCTPVGTRELGKRIAERAHAAALRADEPA